MVYTRIMYPLDIYQVSLLGTVLFCSAGATVLAPHSLILYCLLALHSCYWPTRIGIIESNCKADDKIIPIIMLPLALPNQALRDASKLHCLQARSGTSPSLMSYILYCTPPPITRSPIPDPRSPTPRPYAVRRPRWMVYVLLIHLYPCACRQTIPKPRQRRNTICDHPHDLHRAL